MGRTCSVGCNVGSNIDHGLHSSLFWSRTLLRSRLRSEGEELPRGPACPFHCCLIQDGSCLPEFCIQTRGHPLCSAAFFPSVLWFTFSLGEKDMACPGKCEKCLQFSIYEEMTHLTFNSLNPDWLPCSFIQQSLLRDTYCVPVSELTSQSSPSDKGTATRILTWLNEGSDTHKAHRGTGKETLTQHSVKVNHSMTSFVWPHPFFQNTWLLLVYIKAFK